MHLETREGNCSRIAIVRRGDGLAATMVWESKKGEDLGGQPAGLGGRTGKWSLNLAVWPITADTAITRKGIPTFGARFARQPAYRADLRALTCSFPCITMAMAIRTGLPHSYRQCPRLVAPYEHRPSIPRM